MGLVQKVDNQMDINNAEQRELRETGYGLHEVCLVDEESLF